MIINWSGREFAIRTDWTKDAHITVGESPMVELDERGVEMKISARSGYGLTVESARDLLVAVSIAVDLAELINEGRADEIAAAREREEREREERKRAAEERAAAVEARRERLMTEFMGEEVKVRETGYKTMRKATVDVYQPLSVRNGEDGEWRLRLDYHGHDARTQNVAAMRRLDVLVGGRWKTVWDDGTDDVYGELSSSAARVEMYDGQLS
jgi:hypothetical protein